VTVRASAPPGLAEQAALIALPLSTGFGVWWLLAAWTGRGSREAKREAGEPKETLP